MWSGTAPLFLFQFWLPPDIPPSPSLPLSPHLHVFSGQHCEGSFVFTVIPVWFVSLLCSLFHHALYLYGLFHRCIVCFTMHYTCMLCFTIIPVWFVTLFHSYTCMVCFTIIPVWFVSLLYLYGLLCRQSCCPIQNHGESGSSRCNGRGEALKHVCCRFCLCWKTQSVFDTYYQKYHQPLIFVTRNTVSL